MFNKQIAAYEEPTKTDVTVISLDDLWVEAEQYGRLSCFRSDFEGKYWCTIKFQAVAGITLEADGTGATIHKAFINAIKKAKDIKSQFKT